MAADADPPTDPVDRLAAVARESLHIAVGLGVLAFQDLQVRRRRLEDQLADSADGDRIRDTVHWLVGWNDEDR